MYNYICGQVKVAYIEKIEKLFSNESQLYKYTRKYSKKKQNGVL